MPVDRCGQSINSERFGFSISELYVQSINCAYIQREINDAEYRSGAGGGGGRGRKDRR